MKLNLVIFFLLGHLIISGQTTKKNKCSEPLDIKVDLELLQKVSKKIKNNIDLFRKNESSKDIIILEKSDIEKYLKNGNLKNCGYFLQLFRNKNLSKTGTIEFFPNPPFTIYFVLKECNNYTHQIVFDPLSQFSKGMSGDNRTVYKKGLNLGFSYMINHYDSTYEDVFRQKN
jgi:hypothetical protein